MLLRFIRSRAGNTAMLMALMMIPVAFAGGAAIDVARVVRSKSAVQAAADTAALAYLKEYLASGKSATAAEGAARNAFAANLTEQRLGDVDLVRFAVSVDDGAGTVEARLDYTIDLPLAFSGLIGVDSFAVDGGAAARTGVKPDTRIAVAIDASDSMGLAATEADRTVMRGVFASCEFACHVDDGWATESGLKIARDNGVRLRIDVARDAFRALLTEAKALGPGAGVKVALDLFHADRYPVVPYTGDFDLLSSKATGMEIGYGLDATTLSRTDYTALFAALDSALDGPASTSTAKRTDVLLLITDGVHSRQHGLPFTDVKPIDPALCDTLKKKGIVVAVVYTRYLKFYDSVGAFEAQVEPFYDEIDPNLQACASPGYFAHGDTPSEIVAATLKIMQTLKSSLFVSG